MMHSLRTFILVTTCSSVWLDFSGGTSLATAASVDESEEAKPRLHRTKKSKSEKADWGGTRTTTTTTTTSTPWITNLDVSCVTVGQATNITFRGASPGDKVKFEIDCQNSSFITGFEDVRDDSQAEVTIQQEGTLKLCYKRGNTKLSAEHTLTLDAKPPTSPASIFSISPTHVHKLEPTEITLTGPNQLGGKVCFSPSCDLCFKLYDGKNYPLVDIPGTVTFRKEENMLSSIYPLFDSNEYKICYQGPNNCDWVEQAGGLKVRWDPYIRKITPSCVGANVSTAITFDGAWPGDRVEFAKDCNRISEPAVALSGESKSAIWYNSLAGDGLTLCYKPYESKHIAPGISPQVQGQVHIALRVMNPSAQPNAVLTFSPRIVSEDGETTIYLWGNWGTDHNGNTVTGGQICFGDESCSQCSERERALEIKLQEASPGPIGTVAYKKERDASDDVSELYLCYRLPDSCNWVRQAGDKTLQVVKREDVPTQTRPNQISEITPGLLTIYAKTTVTFKGAQFGDKAKLIPQKITTNCDERTAVPEKDVSNGFAVFKLALTGTHVLCYRAANAQDSVLQSNVNITVLPPGAQRVMLGQWKGKMGKLDCTSLRLVPSCGMADALTCERSYSVYRAVGYRCSVKNVGWASLCDLNMEEATADTICAPGKCAGSPSYCWGANQTVAQRQRAANTTANDNKTRADLPATSRSN